MKYEPKSVGMKNFMAFGNKEIVYDLTTKGTTLFIGNNEDVGEPGKSRNGAGKSTVMQAVIYAIYGKGVIKKMAVDDFVNFKNKKNLIVEHVFKRGDEEYKIIRKRKPGSLEVIRVNDNKSLTLDTTANTQKLIEELVGVSYEVFVMVYFMAPYLDGFTAMSGPDQRNIIESILSLDVLTQRSEAIKKVVKDILKIDLKLAQRDRDNAVGNREKELQNITRLKEKEKDFNEKHNEKLEELRTLKDELSSIDYEYLENMLTKMLKEEKTLAGNKEKLDSINKQIAEIETKISDIRLEIKDSENIVAGYNKVLKSHTDWFKTREEEREKLKEPEMTLDEIKSSYADIDEAYEALEEYVEKSKKRTELYRVLDNKNESLIKEEDKLKIHLTGECFECGAPRVDKEKEKTLKDNIAELKRDIKKITDELSGITLNEEPPATKKELSELKDIIFQHEKERERYDAAIERFDTEKNPHQTELSSYSIDKVEQAETDVIEKQDKIAQLTLNKTSLEDSKKGISVVFDKDKFAEILDLNIHTDADLKLLMGEINTVNEEIARVESEENPYSTEIEHLESNLIDIEEYEDKVNNIQKDITHAEYLVKLLTDPKSFVRKNIIDKYIPFLNKKMIEYTDELGLMHICEINSDLSVTVTYMGDSVSPHTMSQGEKLRLTLATNLAFRDLITVLGKGSKLLMVDEFLDGAGDDYVVEQAFKILTSMDESVMMITHRENLMDSVDHVVQVTKRNGFSSIEYL